MDLSPDDEDLLLRFTEFAREIDQMPAEVRPTEFIRFLLIFEDRTFRTGDRQRYHRVMHALFDLFRRELFAPGTGDED